MWATVFITIPHSSLCLPQTTPSPAPLYSAFHLESSPRSCWLVKSPSIPQGQIQPLTFLGDLPWPFKPTKLSPFSPFLWRGPWQTMQVFFIFQNEETWGLGLQFPICRMEAIMLCFLSAARGIVKFSWDRRLISTVCALVLKHVEWAGKFYPVPKNNEFSYCMDTWTNAYVFISRQTVLRQS